MFGEAVPSEERFVSGNAEHEINYVFFLCKIFVQCISCFLKARNLFLFICQEKLESSLL